MYDSYLLQLLLLMQLLFLTPIFPLKAIKMLNSSTPKPLLPWSSNFLFDFIYMFSMVVSLLLLLFKLAKTKRNVDIISTCPSLVLLRQTKIFASVIFSILSLCHGFLSTSLLFSIFLWATRGFQESILQRQGLFLLVQNIISPVCLTDSEKRQLMLLLNILQGSEFLKEKNKARWNTILEAHLKKKVISISSHSFSLKLVLFLGRRRREHIDNVCVWVQPAVQVKVSTH